MTAPHSFHPEMILVPSSLTRAVALLALASAIAGAQGADSTRSQPTPLVSGRDAVFAGVVVLGSAAVSTIDRRVAVSLRSPRWQDREALDDIAHGAKLVNERSLFAAGVATYLVGRVGRMERLADVSFHATEAIVISSVVGTGIRGTLGRTRPFVTAGRDPYDFHPGKGFSELQYRAFPSIHASASMATAVVMAHETGRWWPRSHKVVAPLLYTAALTPGLARMYASKHWASDVVAGVALGAWTGAKVVRYHHGRKHNRLDRWFLRAGEQGGVSLAWRGSF